MTTRREYDPRASQERWLVSYADLVTLLLALFTTLYAASTVDGRKLGPVASSLHESLRVPPKTPMRDRAPRPAAVAPVEVVRREQALDDLGVRLQQELADAISDGSVWVVRDARGLVLSMPEHATFATGSAAVSPEAKSLILRVGAVLAPLPNPIRIEGHTDDVPIRTVRYQSNWELSTARASAVVALLIDSHLIAPERLSAAGYGEHRPQVPNDSPANRTRNRRIDIVVQAVPEPV